MFGITWLFQLQMNWPVLFFTLASCRNFLVESVCRMLACHPVCRVFLLLAQQNNMWPSHGDPPVMRVSCETLLTKGSPL